MVDIQGNTLTAICGVEEARQSPPHCPVSLTHDGKHVPVATDRRQGTSLVLPGDRVGWKAQGAPQRIQGSAGGVGIYTTSMMPKAW